ncbi:MAG: Crp/Fnr family transcriptional regulator [Gammaproteobacteria bacterium]|nr:Crp/Fnr family transcriptional regulator [Gammaproteobacteria bacterium]
MSAGREQLLALYDGLDSADRHALLVFAEFLAAREPARALEPVAAPRDLPRPPGESVIAALKRLRATYPMLEAAPLLDAATGLLAAHVLHGREAEEVIDELERLFADAYAGRAARSGDGG